MNGLLIADAVSFWFALADALRQCDIFADIDMSMPSAYVLLGSFEQSLQYESCPVACSTRRRHSQLESGDIDREHAYHLWSLPHVHPEAEAREPSIGPWHVPPTFPVRVCGTRT